MNTNLWGKHAWILFHTVAYNYPEKSPSKSKQDHTKIFYENLKFNLPCKYCRESYTKFLKELPISSYLSSREKLTMWAYLMHNKVNNKLIKQGKSIKIPTKKQVDKRFEKFRVIK